MGAFDAAWSVIKADPRMQAYAVLPYFNMHPDLEDYHRGQQNENEREVQNLGTVDPNVMAMLLRRQSGGREGDHPQRQMSRMLRHPTMGRGGASSFHDSMSPTSLQGKPSSEYYTNPGGGFKDGTISREPRPEVDRHMTVPRFRSPQQRIDFDAHQRRHYGLPPATDEQIQALLDAPPFNPVSELVIYD